MAVKGDSGHRRTQAERRASTRAALIAAARELFAEKGFAGAGREEIVERAGVTRGAMYHHFASKEDAVPGRVRADRGGGPGPDRRGGDDRSPIRSSSCERGSLAYLDVAANADVRRICLLDAPSVLPTEVRRELAERYGLGLVRECARRAAWRPGQIARQPVEPLARLLLAALLEAATLVAEGDRPSRGRRRRRPHPGRARCERPHDCDLCVAARLTEWFHEDDDCWVAQCTICATPMIVWKSHDPSPPADV